MFKLRNWTVTIVLFLSVFLLMACVGGKQFDVTFEVEGKQTVVSVKKNENVPEPDEPEKEGYRFIGWFLGEEKFDDFNTPITENLTLVAKFEVEKSDLEIGLEAIEYIETNLPKKAHGDFVLPMPDIEGIVVEYKPRTSKVEDGVWIYKKQHFDYKEIFDIYVKYGFFATEIVAEVQVYGYTDWEKFDVVTELLDAFMEENKYLEDQIVDDMELPSQFEDVTIQWISSNNDVLTAKVNEETDEVINNELNYIRPNNHTDVKLTAILRAGKSTYSKVYSVEAKGFTQEEKIDYFKASKTYTDLFEKGYSTDVNLPTVDTRFNFNIEWISSNTEVLTHDGVFLNPAEDTEITITAVLRYQMKLVKDPETEEESYEPATPHGFETTVEIPYTVKAIETAVGRAAYDLSKDLRENLDRVFYYGKIDGNKFTDIEGLPTTVEGHEGSIVEYLPDEDGNFDEEITLLVQPFLFKETTIKAKVTLDGESVEVPVTLQISLLGKDDIGISSVTSMPNSPWFDPLAYAEANGFDNHFDEGKNISGRDFQTNGIIAKSHFKWYHQDPMVVDEETGEEVFDKNTPYTEANFFYFFRNNTFVYLDDAHLETEAETIGEGEDAVEAYRVTGATGTHSGSYLKGVINRTDKDAVIKGDQLKAKFGLQQHALYQLYIYDAEGNRVFMAGGADVEHEYIIPAGGFILERGYIDGAATNAFFMNAEKIELITVKRHTKYGG